MSWLSNLFNRRPIIKVSSAPVNVVTTDRQRVDSGTPLPKPASRDRSPSNTSSLDSIAIKQLFDEVIKAARRIDKQSRITFSKEVDTKKLIQLLDALSLKATTDPAALLYLAYLHARCPVWGGVVNNERAKEYYRKAFKLADELKIDIDMKLDLYQVAFQLKLIKQEKFKKKLQEYATNSTAKVMEIALTCEADSKELAFEIYQLAYEQGKLARPAYLSQLARLGRYLPDKVFEAYIDVADKEGGYKAVVKLANVLFPALNKKNQQALIDLHSENGRDDLMVYYHNLRLYKTAEDAKNSSFNPFNADNFISAYISYEHLQQQQFCSEGTSYLDQLTWLTRELSPDQAATVADSFVKYYYCESESEEFHRLSAIFCQLAYTKDSSQDKYRVMADRYGKTTPPVTGPPPVAPKPSAKKSSSKTAPPPVSQKPRSNKKLSTILKTLRQGDPASVSKTIVAQNQDVASEFRTLLNGQRFKFASDYRRSCAPQSAEPSGNQVAQHMQTSLKA